MNVEEKSTAALVAEDAQPLGYMDTIEQMAFAQDELKAATLALQKTEAAFAYAKGNNRGWYVKVMTHPEKNIATELLPLHGFYDPDAPKKKKAKK